MIQFDEEYFAEKISEGLFTGRIELDNAVIEWHVTDDCLSGCRTYDFGQVHQIGCPLIPAIRAWAWANEQRDRKTP